MIKTRIRQSTVTITTTATKIPATPLPTRKSILVQNVGASSVYIGDSTVTTSDGYKLDAGGEFAWDISETIDIYGIAASGSVELRIIEGANPN